MTLPNIMDWWKQQGLPVDHSEVVAHTPDPTRYHDLEPGQTSRVGQKGAMIPRAGREGASQGFDANRAGPMLVDPDHNDGGKVFYPEQLRKLSEQDPQAVGNILAQVGSVGAGRTTDEQTLDFVNRLSLPVSAAAQMHLPPPVPALAGPPTPAAAAPPPAASAALAAPAVPVAAFPPAPLQAATVSPAIKFASAPVLETPETPAMPAFPGYQPQPVAQPIAQLSAPQPLPSAVDRSAEASLLQLLLQKLQPAAPVAAPAPPPAAPPTPAVPLEIPFLESRQPLKPSETVAVNLGGALGLLSARFHAVIEDARCVVLVYDTRYEDGQQWIPAATGPDQFLELTVKRSGKTHRVCSMGLQFNLGCLDFVVLIAAAPIESPS